MLTLVAIAWSWSGSAYAQSNGAPRPEIVRLEAALQQYRQIAESGGWPEVPTGPTIEPGSRDHRVPILAQRLQSTGDLLGKRDAWPAYNEDLQAAVTRFQARHGLEPDARVGQATLRALNVTAEQRVQQLAINLERSRQVFKASRRDLLLVNIPAFEAYLVREGNTVWATRVIVGEADAETPVFEAELNQIVLNPTWAVPRSIATQDLLPMIKHDVGFLESGGFKLFTADGTTVSPIAVDWAALHEHNFPFTLVQRAGPQNELGQVKFLFPNPHGVCMHDTPKKPLFSHYSRAYSHGCIRLDQPLELAQQLLKAEGWTRAEIDAQLASERTQPIVLAEPLPIVVTYLTARVDDTGTVLFYRDIYGRD